MESLGDEREGKRRLPLIWTTHNLLQWVKAAIFGASPLAAVGTRELVEKVGRIPARRERMARPKPNITAFNRNVTYL